MYNLWYNEIGSDLVALSPDLKLELSIRDVMCYVWMQTGNLRRICQMIERVTPWLTHSRLICLMCVFSLVRCSAAPLYHLSLQLPFWGFLKNSEIGSFFVCDWHWHWHCHNINRTTVGADHDHVLQCRIVEYYNTMLRLKLVPNLATYQHLMKCLLHRMDPNSKITKRIRFVFFYLLEFGSCLLKMIPAGTTCNISGFPQWMWWCLQWNKTLSGTCMFLSFANMLTRFIRMKPNKDGPCAPE
jgi:hypothetical protein